jgi:prolyl-tRNA editing enzyme YbaK/EbsC (Cys-tRNA(Pro) deacylase)
MKETVQRVMTALAEAGVQTEVREFAASTRTAEAAANALGATVGQIVKSLVFLAGDRPILALVSGVNRADTAKLQALVDAEITRANADDVRRITGYAIGGVPPFGHLTFLTTYLDRDLLQYEEVWAAAGTPNAVFAITPHDLLRITAAQVADVAEAVH